MSFTRQPKTPPVRQTTPKNCCTRQIGVSSAAPIAPRVTLPVRRPSQPIRTRFSGR